MTFLLAMIRLLAVPLALTLWLALLSLSEFYLLYFLFCMI